MGQRRIPGVTREMTADQKMRDEEVLRANGELAEYFKGQRTEREARAALKIIKAFVRDREHGDEKSRRPLPSVEIAKAPKKARKLEKAPTRATNRRTERNAKKRQPRRPRRTPQKRSSVPVQESAVSEPTERPPE